MQSKGDRFISQRGLEGDDSTRQRIKQELYSSAFVSPTKPRRTPGEDDPVQGQQPREDTLQLEEDNKKTYRALL